MDIALRRYRHEDLQAIFRMDQVCFPEPFRFSLRSMRRFAEAGDAISLVAYRGEVGPGGPIVGFVIAHLEDVGLAREGYVTTLDVAPEMRRLGVAKRLMAGVEELAAEAGACRMTLHVFARNEGAIRTYEELGYRRTGTVEGFYGVDGVGPLDAFLYAKELGAG